MIILILLLLFSVKTLAQWTWISGKNTINDVGVYGQLGVPSPSNIPGGRHKVAVDIYPQTNQFVLFGGVGSVGTLIIRH